MTRIDRALVIRSPHIDRILAKRKTWEIRGSRTDVRGRIGLIQAGSGLIVGTCELVDVIGPLSLREFKANAKKVGVAADEITSLPYDDSTYAWVLVRAERLKRPRPYSHPSGAVRWVKVEMRS